MKQFFLALTLFLLAGVSSMYADVLPANTIVDFKEIGKSEGIDLSALPNGSVQDFLDLTPGKLKAQTGHKLSIKEAFALKMAQKKVKKAFTASQPGAPGSKSQLVAFLLCFFLGFIGVHRFYLGYIGIGIIQLLTLGGCGIWALVDLILIATGDLRAKNGQDLEPW